MKVGRFQGGCDRAATLATHSNNGLPVEHLRLTPESALGAVVAGSGGMQSLKSTERKTGLQLNGGVTEQCPGGRPQSTHGVVVECEAEAVESPGR